MQGVCRVMYAPPWRSIQHSNIATSRSFGVQHCCEYCMSSLQLAATLAKPSGEGRLGGGRREEGAAVCEQGRSTCWSSSAANDIQQQPKLTKSKTLQLSKCPNCSQSSRMSNSVEQTLLGVSSLAPSGLSLGSQRTNSSTQLCVTLLGTSNRERLSGQ